MSAEDCTAYRVIDGSYYVIPYREMVRANRQNRRPELVVDARPTGMGCEHIGDKFSEGGQ